MPNITNTKATTKLHLFLLGVFISSYWLFPTSSVHAEDEAYLRLSQNRGPTGTVLTIEGRVLGSPGHEAGCGPLGLSDSTNDTLPFGETCWGSDGLFSWTGPIPREGGWRHGPNFDYTIKAVPPGTITIGFYAPLLTLPTSITSEATFTVTDNGTGPYADNFPDGKFILLDQFVAMRELWSKTDQLVAEGRTKRSWLWGLPHYTTFLEPYEDGANGWRYVRYYDKTRMEVTLASALLPSNPYYVTNGLLVQEMVTGRLQLGDNAFEERPASRIQVAGDLDEVNPAPGFAQFAIYRDFNPYTPNALINRTIGLQTHNGVEPEPAYNRFNVRAVHLVPQTNHYIATPFWDFLNTSGPLLNTAARVYNGRLFEPLFFATGLPITEAYWTKARVSGVERDVLVQLFERRVLTYTPSNQAGFQIEMGNTGMQYFQWRYGEQ